MHVYEYSIPYINPFTSNYVFLKAEDVLINPVSARNLLAHWDMGDQMFLQH